MKLKVNEWKPFRIDSIFDVFTGGDLIMSEIEEGDIPIASNSSENNNIAAYTEFIPNRKLFDHTKSISIADRGKFWAFIQPKDFYLATRVKGLVCKEANILNEFQLAFIVSVLNQESFKFSYGRNCCANLPNIEIYLPIQHNLDGESIIDDKCTYSEDGYVPDWKWMEEYMKSLHHEPLTTRNKAGTGIELNVNGWKEFIFNKIFTLKGGFYNKKPEHSIEGKIPFLASTECNNGVTEYYSVDDICQWDKVGNEDFTLDKKIYNGNCIAVTVNGSVCNAFYQIEDFTCSHDITALYLNGYEMNPYLATFLCTIIMQDKYRWSYGRKPHDVKKFGRSVMKLPIQHDVNGNPVLDDTCRYSEEGYIPDWKFMENYIKVLPYGDRL